LSDEFVKAIAPSGKKTLTASVLNWPDILHSIKISGPLDY